MADVALLGGQRIAAGNFEIEIDDQGNAIGDYLGSDGFNRSAGFTITLDGNGNTIITLTLGREVNNHDCAIQVTGHVREEFGSYYHVDGSAIATGAPNTSTSEIVVTLFNPTNFPQNQTKIGFYITVFRLNRG